MNRNKVALHNIITEREREKAGNRKSESLTLFGPVRWTWMHPILTQVTVVANANIGKN